MKMPYLNKVARFYVEISILPGKGLINSTEKSCPGF